MGQKLEGPATVLLIADTEADAKHYPLDELGFITVSTTILVSDAIHVGPVDAKHELSVIFDVRHVTHPVNTTLGLGTIH
jgi:hypothetical protein